METYRKQREVSEMAGALCTHVTCCSRYEWQKTAREKILWVRTTKTSASEVDSREGVCGGACRKPFFSAEQHAQTGEAEAHLASETQRHAGETPIIPH